MRRYFSASFDVDLAMAWYEEYDQKQTQDNLNEAVKACIPFVRLVFNHQVGRSQRRNRDYIEAEGITAVMTCIQGRDIPTDTPRRFKSFLYTSIYRAFIKVIQRQLAPEEFDALYECKPAPYSIYGKHQATETKIQRRDLQQSIDTAVRASFRFIGRERDACNFILDCLTGRSSQDPKFVRRRFHLRGRQTTFLIKYVTILLRHETSEHLRGS